MPSLRAMSRIAGRAAIFAIELVAACGGAPARTPSERHDLRFHFPARIGDEFRLTVRSASLVELSRCSGSGRVSETHASKSLALEGLVRIQYVSETGDVRAIRCQIIECEIREKDMPKRIIPSGKVVLGKEFSGDAIYSWEDGGRVPAVLEGALQVLLPVSDGPPYLDSAFKAPLSLRVGEESIGDSGALAEYLRSMGVRCLERDVHGQARLVRTLTWEGVESLEYVCGIEVSALDVSELPAKQLDTGASPTSQYSFQAKVIAPKAQDRLPFVEAAAGRGRIQVFRSGKSVETTFSFDYHVRRDHSPGPTPESR